MASWPEAESLAKLLEADVTVRRRLREKGHMTRWPTMHTVGVPSCKAMSCNARILEIIAEWWCPTCDSPAILPIELVRREAGSRFVAAGRSSCSESYNSIILFGR